jgi:hypothetical protein
MGCRGVHFAITDKQANQLLAAEDDDAVMELIEEIEESWDEKNLAESDKAWDAIHRCLTDGTLNDGENYYPLNLMVLGGKQLHQEDDYFVTLVSSDQVKEVSAAIISITEEWFRQRYFSLLDPQEYDSVEIGEDDFSYTWENFCDVRQLFVRAAKSKNKSAIVFTVDQ